MIQIDILLPNDTLLPGALLEGMVQIKADAKATYESLDFECTWTDPGTTEVIGRQSGSLLRAGALRAEEERRVPFAVQLPDQGEIAVRLDDLVWELRAELRLKEEDNAVTSKHFSVATRRQRDKKTAQQFSKGKSAPDSDARAGKAARPAPTTIGDVIGGLFISSFFFGFIAGGVILCFNGVPDRVLPDFVPWFGVVCLLGGLFVVQKIWEGLYPAFGRGLVALIASSLTLIALYSAVIEPGFSILQGSPPSPQSHGVDHLGSTYGLLAWLMAICLGTWLAHSLAKRRSGDTSMTTGLLMLAIVGVGLAVGVLAAPARLANQIELYGAGIVGLVALVIVGRGKNWRRPSARFALIAMAAPLLLAVGLFRVGDTPALAAGGTIVGLLALYAFFSLRSLAAEAWLGEVKLQVTPEKPYPGGMVRLEVSMTPRKDAQIQNIRAELICTNHYRGADPEDNDSSVYSRQALKGMFPVKVFAGKPITLPLSSVLALDAPPTQTGSNGYSWELQVHIDLAGAPDWEDLLTVVVER